jgi:hypothetical protein
MQQQTLSELRILLQQKVFGHKAAQQFNNYSQAILGKLSACHTSKIGMHVYECGNANCSKQHVTYHSCNNRHCPNCGGLKREQWILDRHTELLPTSYFHLVFTLPAQLRSLCMGNRTVMFDLLFKASTYTIRTLCKEDRFLGAVPGVVSVLHTNGQDLNWHPHVHCIVTGGGVHAHKQRTEIVDDDGVINTLTNTKHTWINAKRNNGKYFLPKPLLQDMFRDKYLEELVQLYDDDKLKITEAELQLLVDELSAMRWNVHAKAPFGGPHQVIEYLGRYTHKVAITAQRIVSITDTHICFNYKDYADGHKQKQMTLTIEEFLQRFEQHILPNGFVKIRHSGFLSAAYKNDRLATIHEQLKLPAPTPKVKLPVVALAAMRYGADIAQCPHCSTGKLHLKATLVYYNFTLVNVKDLRARGSPLKHLDSLCL